MRIALDAMGGDAAPAEIVRGALLAAESFPQAEILLIGDESAIRRELEAAGRDSPPFAVVHAPETIGMHEAPVAAIKRKRDSSIVKALGLVAAGEAEAVVSAGNTGAVVAGATFHLKPLEGVKRPGIACTVPTSRGMSTVIDMGANVDCKPVHLFQYAVMAANYHSLIVRTDDTSVGLLSVGHEEAKGNRLVKDTYPMLSASELNFVGNVEGGDIFRGGCDVIVCDGFVGNAILKAAEEFADLFFSLLKSDAERDTWTRLGMKLADPALAEHRRRMDFAEYGGAPMLGVDGICIICHGRSHATAIKNAIGAALRCSRQDVNGRIISALEASRSIWDSGAENEE